MYVRSVDIVNLRSFEATQIHFQFPGRPVKEPSGVRALPNVTLLLGSNGSGKTSVLRAVALSVLGQVLAQGSGLRPSSLVRRTRLQTSHDATVRAGLALHPQDVSRRKVDDRVCVLFPADRFGDRIVEWTPWPESAIRNPDSPPYFIVGYGATRRVETSGSVSDSSRYKERSPRYMRVAGLFEEHVTLMPLAGWLPHFAVRNPGRFKQVVNLINRLLPDVTLQPKLDGDEYLFLHKGSLVPFSALSDGYRAFVSWVADLLFHICRTAPSGKKLVEHHGVVMVDEIDLHLHPEWQRTVVPSLSTVFPNLQFILTSHSPLVAGTLAAANVRTMREVHGKGEESSYVVEPARVETYGMSAEQILTSELFGLDAARDKEFTETLRGIAAKARDGDPEAALQTMRILSGGAAALGPTPTSLFKRPSPKRRVVAAKKSRLPARGKRAK